MLGARGHAHGSPRRAVGGLVEALASPWTTFSRRSEPCGRSWNTGGSPGEALERPWETLEKPLECAWKASACAWQRLAALVRFGKPTGGPDGNPCVSTKFWRCGL